ncbi:MAG: bifunctional methylenetetrahydrofolate dehydrogenase/methenyltetrahydrofolate cyclohydrolase FolD [Pseudomonadota bacterium]
MTGDPAMKDDASAEIIDGKAVGEDIVASVRTQTEALVAASNVTPGLAVVLVGADPASQVYVRNKSVKAEACGFKSEQHTMPADMSEADLLDLVGRLNADPTIHGILVQLPLPDHIDETRVLRAIDPRKDVDGFHPINVGLLSTGALEEALVPCTPAGCHLLLKRRFGADLSGRNALVIGRSNIVGKPMAQLLLSESCTVTVAHSRTRDLPALSRSMDIIVAAVGRPEMVRGDWIGPGAVVIDVGINRIDAPEKGPGKTRLVGDVCFDEAVGRAAAITPVPGGIGPMTIAMLMANTLTAACRAAGAADPQF